MDFKGTVELTEGEEKQEDVGDGVYLSDESSFYGDEATKASLEARTAAFDPADAIIVRGHCRKAWRTAIGFGPWLPETAGATCIESKQGKHLPRLSCAQQVCEQV